MALNTTLQRESIQVLDNIVEAARQQSRLIDLLLENVGRQQSELQNMIITVKGIPAAMGYTDECSFPFNKTPSLLMYQERNQQPKEPPPPLPTNPPVGCPAYPGPLPPRPAEKELKAIRERELAWFAQYQQDEVKRVDVNNPVRKPANAEDRDHSKLVLALTSPEGRIAPVLETFRTKERAWVACYEAKPDPKQEDRYKRALALDYEFYLTRRVEWRTRYARKLDALPNLPAEQKEMPAYKKDYVTAVILNHMIDCLDEKHTSSDPPSVTPVPEDGEEEQMEEKAVHKTLNKLNI